MEPTTSKENRTGRYSLVAALLLFFLSVGLIAGAMLNLESNSAGTTESVAEDAEGTDDDAASASGADDAGVVDDDDTAGEPSDQETPGQQSEDTGEEPGEHPDPGPGPGCGDGCVGPSDELGQPPTPKLPFNPGLGTKPTPTPTPEGPGIVLPEANPDPGPGPDPTAPPPGPGGFIGN